MRGGISAITLPAGYLGSSLIGALLIFCGFDIVASKVASIVLGVCFLLMLWWARKDWLTIVTVLLSVALLVACWFIKHAEPLRFVVLFIGVMSALYSLWDIVSPCYPSIEPSSSFSLPSFTDNLFVDSATISSSAKSTALIRAFLQKSMEALHTAGASFGRYSRLP